MDKDMAWQYSQGIYQTVAQLRKSATIDAHRAAERLLTERWVTLSQSGICPNCVGAGESFAVDGCPVCCND